MTINPLRALYSRVLLSMAKHPSLQGHPEISRRIARRVAACAYPESAFFGVDGAPAAVEQMRRDGFFRLANRFRSQSPQSIACSQRLEAGVSDLSFVNGHRVPFQFQALVREHLQTVSVADASDGPRIRDLDGNWSYDVGGSYGVNLFGTDFYKGCIDRGVERARDLGLVLGFYHPIVEDNVDRLKRISGLDEVSFHMSGTEAVMQAVRLAQYHTGRSKIVRFSGAYHGWWGEVQAGIGNPRPSRDTLTLKEMDHSTLRVLETRSDIACVLVNPVQSLNPNGLPASDSALVASDRTAAFDKAAYRTWLERLRQVCSTRNIALIFDEVFLGFRLAAGGAQEYFSVRADLVTYGKSLGGGLPVGVLCGRTNLMRRDRDDHPMDICFARGTFNAHPYVMTAMNEFLRHIDRAEVRSHYETIDTCWNGRALALNQHLEQLALPVRVVNLASVWTTLYTIPSRYNWMFQFYLRAHGLAPAWIGTGRFIFSHDLDDNQFGAIHERFVAAARAMSDDGWWWHDGTLTNASIKRRVVRELITASFGRRPWDPSTVHARAKAVPNGRSSHREAGPSGSW